MGNIERGKGTAKEIAGKIEKTAGRITGSERTEASGRSRELEGRAQKEGAKAKERVKGAVEEVAGKVQKGAGKLVGSDEHQIKGAARELKGQVRQKAND